ncbi:MAG: lysophospholipid acyltransferase family protein [Chloroflexota bacterium]
MWLLRLLKIAAVLTPIVPAPVGYLLCRLFGVLYYLGNKTVRASINHNLRHVVPHAGSWQRRILAARSCVTVVTNYYDLLRMRSVDRGSIQSSVEIAGLEHIERAQQRGRGVIILSAHVGNFSVVARLSTELGYTAALIAEKVEPPSLFSYKVRLRSAMGIEVIPPGASTVRRITRLLRSDGMLLVAGDRDVTGSGIPVRFFGTETPLPPGPIVLAMRTGAALVPAYTVRSASNRSRVVVGPELRLACTGDWEVDLRTNLQRMASAMEPMIAADPGQWAVLQRVWPPTSQYGRSDGLGSADPYADEIRPERDVQEHEPVEVSRAR